MRFGWLLAIAACRGQAPPPAPPPTQVGAMTLAATPVQESSEYLANLRSRTAAAIQPQVDGQVQQIFVRQGDLVEPGRPLFQIDPGVAPSNVTQAQASIEARRAALVLAEENHRRAQALVQGGALPRQNLDNATSALDTAKADLAAAEAAIRGNRVTLEYYRVAAPARGEVGDVPVRVGDRVTPQTTLTTITDNRVLEANLAVPVERSRQLRLGAPVVIVDATGKQLGAGKIEFIAAQVNPATQAILVKADIENASGALRASQIVRARVVWSTHPGIVIPPLAVIRRGAQAFVYVVVRSGNATVARQHPVQLGELLEQGYVVTSGLVPGERIVTSNIQKVRDGEQVAVGP